MSYSITSRYAKSLIDLATEQGKLDRVLDDMTGFQKAAQVRDLAMLLKSPIIKPDQKGKVLDAIFGGKIDPLTQNFMHIILRKGRESLLAEIASEFIHQYRTIKGISTVEVTSAEPLTNDTLDAIRRKLIESKLTHGTVEFKTKTDPSLIGGFVIAFEDKLYDASVRHQLDQLRKQFTSKDYQVSI